MTVKMKVDHVIGYKITLYQRIYLIKVLNYFKILKCKLACILIDSGVANSLLFCNRKANKEIIK